jgi:hypothetical protein
MQALDPNFLAVIGLIGLAFYQIVTNNIQNKRYTNAIMKNAEAIENSNKAINSLREIMIHINASDGIHEKLLVAILDKFTK